MEGTKIGRALMTGVLAAMLAAGGCKKGKDSATPADGASRLSAETMRLQGMYRYMADAGLFLDCATKKQWPVATEGDNAALERAYGKAKVAAGSSLLVTVDGRLEPRREMDGDGTETTLIVERFVRTWAGETCEGMFEITLQDTRSTLLELNGKPLVAPARENAPYLELSSKKKSAFGFGGCNRFFGTYEATGRSLTFGAMGATRMACPEGMAQEQALFTALDATDRYEIHGSELLLFAGDTLLARFEATGKPG